MSLDIKKWIKINTVQKKHIPQHSFYISTKKNMEKTSKKTFSFLHDWQIKTLLKGDKNFYSFQTKEGICYLSILNDTPTGPHSCESILPSDYSIARDACTPFVKALKELSSESIVSVNFLSLNDDQVQGTLVGLEMCAYQFKGNSNLPFLTFIRDEKPLPLNNFENALQSAYAVNTARHLTNLPPNELNPESYANWLSKEWKNEKNWDVEVLGKERLKKEGYNLILAVGNSAMYSPALVHLSYRPDKKSKEKPLCFIGKGITFDSGGLDLKPSQGMRLMKKDMGGSACLAGLATYIKNTKPNYPCDFYFALAENAVDECAFRPGDIFYTKNGMSIEISNTDAEGRLVLADAFILAQEHNQKYKAIIDVATLTGAGKVALGPDVSSLFSNNEKLTQNLLHAAHMSGDPCWNMPLVSEYESMLTSPFADMANSAEGGYAGAITAALFLKKFINSETPWAHFDIFAWQDGSKGAYLERGGSGQTTQSLIYYYENLIKNP